MGREMRKRVELDATPEQVWEAIATGPGITAWFVPATVDPQVGGVVTQAFGGGADVAGVVTAYEPGRRFAYGAAGEVPEGTPSYAFEFLVEGRDGGGAVLTFVQSGFLDEGWEDEYDSLDHGWDLFFGNLREYLARFAGEPAQGVTTMAFAAGTPATVWPHLLRGLGLERQPAVGDTVTVTPDGLAPITGVVDVVSPEFLGLRSAHGLHRIGAEGSQGCGVSAYHYFYGEPVDADALTEAWQAWLTKVAPTAP